MYEFAPFYALIPFGEFETPLGFASRIAYANGFGPLRRFCGTLGFNVTGIRSGEPETIRRLAGHAKVDAGNLGRFAFRRGHVGYKVAFGAEMIDHSMLHAAMRYCPHCAVADIGSSDERPAAAARLRAQWHLDFATCCEVHEVELLTAGGQDDLDFGRFIDIHESDLENARRTSKQARQSAADSYFVARVLGTERPSCALDVFSLTQAVEIASALGRLETGVDRRVKDLSASEREEVRQVGFEIAKDGVDGIVSYFDARVQTVRRDRRTVYGGLIRLLQKNGGFPEFTTFAAQVRQHAIASLGLSSRTRILGSVKVRVSHSVASAAKEYGVPSKKVVAELVRSSIVGPDALEKRPNDVVFPCEAASEILATLSVRVDVEKAAAILGVTRLLIHQLADQGLFRLRTH